MNFVEKLQRVPKNIWVILFYWSVTFSEGALQIIVPLYFVSLGISATQIGLTFFTLEGFGLLMSLAGGFIINKYGYKKTFLFSLLLNAVSCLGYLLFSFNFPRALFLMLVNVLRALQGMAKELIKTTGTVYLKQPTSAKNRFLPSQLLLGGRESIKGLGILFGGLLYSSLGFTTTFLFLTLASLLPAYFAKLLLNDYFEKQKATLLGFFKVKKAMHFLAFAMSFLYFGRDLWLMVPLPLYLQSQGFTTNETVLTLAIGIILFGISQPLFAIFIKVKLSFLGKKLKKKWRYRDPLPWSAFVLSVFMLCFFLLPNDKKCIFWFLCFYNILAGIATAPHNHLHIKFADESKPSIDISYYKTVSQLGRVVACLFSGIFYEAYGFSFCVTIAGAFILLAGVLSYYLSNSRFKLKFKDL